MLDIHQLCFHYQASHPLIDSLSLSVAKGEMLGLLGPNGAGKTTLVSLIAGLLKPTAGDIFINGIHCDGSRSELALVPQEYAFYPRLTARENLEYFAGVIGLSGTLRREKVRQLMAKCELDSAHQPLAGHYSGGLKRRLNFAIGLLQDPKLLILDEPTANIDPQSRLFLLDMVRELNGTGTSIIYTSHVLQEVEDLCHRVAVLDHGKIVLEGKISDLLNTDPSLITITTLQPLPEAFLTQAGVKQLANCQVEINTHVLKQSPAALLLWLEQQQIDVQQLHMGRGRLEEVFFKATERELRE